MNRLVSKISDNNKIDQHLSAFSCTLNYFGLPPVKNKANIYDVSLKFNSESVQINGPKGQVIKNKFI